MQCIIAAKKENRQLHPGFAPDDEASIEYYSDLALSPDSFIRAYSKFEMTLRNILAGINARKQKIPVENVVLGSDSVAESIRKSGSPDFGLAAENPWVNKILALPSDDPIESEKRIDQIRWSVMDELSAFAGFGAAVVFVFVLKLRSAERWKMLSADIGKSFTEKLVADTRMKLEELIRL
jgi:hypothetical protein